MLKRFIFATIILLSLFSFISADMMPTGFKPIKVSNTITNLNEFPDFVFVMSGHINTGMCPIKIINKPSMEDTGRIHSYYKFCNPSVYAIPRSRFNETELMSLNTKEVLNEQEMMDSLSDEQVIFYLNSLGAKEVIKNVQTYKTVPVSSTQEEIINFYEISLASVLDQPSYKKVVYNNLIYVYVLISLVAILIILLIVLKHKKKK